MIDSGTILVADDSSDDVELFKRAIKKAGLTNPIQFVTDGTALMDYLKEDAEADGEFSLPLLLFLDLKMPRCTGFTVLNWLRQQPHLQNLPTIVLSNSNQPSDIENSLRLGAHGYWVKPARFEDLVRMLVKLKGVFARTKARIESDSGMAVAA